MGTTDTARVPSSDRFCVDQGKRRSATFKRSCLFVPSRQNRTPLHETKEQTFKQNFRRACTSASPMKSAVVDGDLSAANAPPALSIRPWQSEETVTKGLHTSQRAAVHATLHQRIARLQSLRLSSDRLARRRVRSRRRQVFSHGQVNRHKTHTSMTSFF